MVEFTLSTTLNADIETVWALLQKPATMARVSCGWLTFTPVDPPSLPEHWPEQDADFLVRPRAFGVIPLGQQVIATRRPPVAPPKRALRDAGRGSLVKTWDHWIFVEPEGDNRCRYSDHLVLDAGWLTPVVALWARGFYRHRQGNWHRLLAEQAAEAR
ncbi:SRPBCC family protein [Thalassococcus sp. CAU 1522]|uniref:SRPBCC family protein n=1 Tax=Thalassococcus arenae TaxID=2851652 RepID=A0ABS6N7I8_9RHOB|nr:SRPBCC family protein [Thalassococcus arenae]MBV2359969.1 SRPBCC family protein [Thalassococcus arenae]